MFNTKKIVYTGILAGIGIILSFLEFGLPIFPSFLKIDFSFLPAILTALLFSPFFGVVVSLIINAFHLLRTQTGGVGELANVLVSIAFVLPVGYIYMKNKTKKRAVIGLIISILSMTLVGCLANYYILIPFYSKMMPIDAIIKMVPGAHSIIDYIIYAILPFNLLKGFLLSVVVFLLYKSLSRLINGVKSGTN